MVMDLHGKLASMGLELPAAPKPVAAYVPAVRHDNVIYISGQLPLLAGKLLATGPVPSAVTVEQAQVAARQCVLNALAIVDQMIDGDWSRFGQVIRLGAFVCCETGFTAQHLVANGASELLGELFGKAGHHARAAVGVIALPLGASIEVELAVAVTT